MSHTGENRKKMSWGVKAREEKSARWGKTRSWVFPERERNVGNAIRKKKTENSNRKTSGCTFSIGKTYPDGKEVGTNITCKGEVRSDPTGKTISEFIPLPRAASLPWLPHGIKDEGKVLAGSKMGYQGSSRRDYVSGSFPTRGLEGNQIKERKRETTIIITKSAYKR